MDDSASRISSVAASTKTGYKSTTRLGHSGHATASAAEVRDLQSLYDKLRKEMDRKEAKLQSLSKELQATRASQQDHQKELRLVTGSLELVQSEKASLLLEYNKIKKQFDELRKKHVHLSDATKLSSQMEQLKEENERQQQQLQSQQAEIDLRDKRVQTLQYELEVAHKALNVQNRYEGASSSSATSLPGSLGSNRELLRSLYFDLGKAAADNHALSLSLANAEQAQQTSEIALKSVREENCQLKTRLEELETIVATRDTSLRDQNLLISCLQEQVGVLEDKLAVKTQAMEVLLKERDTATERYLTLDRECRRLETQLSQTTNDLQEKLRQVTSLETQSHDTQTRFEQEKDVLLEEIARLRHVDEALAASRDTVTRLTASLDTEQHRFLDLQQQYLEMKASVHLHAHQQHTLSQLVQSKDESLATLQEERRHSLNERDTLAAALTKAMQLVRQLQEQCEEEKRSRFVVEQELQQTMRIKEEMTQAVVSALHEERQKAHDLASALQSLRSAAPPPAPPRMAPGPLTPSTTSTSVTVTSTVQPPPLHPLNSNQSSGGDFQWLRRDAQIDRQVQQMYAQPLPTSTSLSAPTYDVTHAMSNPQFAAALQRVSTSTSNNFNDSDQNNSKQSGDFNSYNSSYNNSYNNNNSNNGVATLPPNTSVVFRDSLLNDLTR